MNEKIGFKSVAVFLNGFFNPHHLYQVERLKARCVVHEEEASRQTRRRAEVAEHLRAVTDEASRLASGLRDPRNYHSSPSPSGDAAAGTRSIAQLITPPPNTQS